MSAVGFEQARGVIYPIRFPLSSIFYKRHIVHRFTPADADARHVIRKRFEHVRSGFFRNALERFIRIVAALHEHDIFYMKNRFKKLVQVVRFVFTHRKIYRNRNDAFPLRLFQIISDLHVRHLIRRGDLRLCFFSDIIIDRDIEQLFIVRHSLTLPTTLLIKKSCARLNKINAGTAMMTLVAMSAPQAVISSPRNVVKPIVSVNLFLLVINDDAMRNSCHT